MHGNPLALLLLYPVRSDVANRVVELATRDLPSGIRGGSNGEKELQWLLDLIQRGVGWVKWGIDDKCHLENVTNDT